MSVNHGGTYITMPQQLPNRPNIVIGLEQMAGKTVSKGVGRSMFSELSFIDCILNSGNAPEGVGIQKALVRSRKAILLQGHMEASGASRWFRSLSGIKRPGYAAFAWPGPPRRSFQILYSGHADKKTTAI